jgi:hypothetical protein
MPITFDAAKITTLSWTNDGFSPDIIACGRELLNYLNDVNIIQKILEFFAARVDIKIDESIINSIKLEFSEERGNEYIKVLDVDDVKIHAYNANKFTIRIYICNKNLGRRAKIYVSSSLGFGAPGLNAEQAVSMSHCIKDVEDKISAFIHEYIPAKYNLGPILYASNIISIESSDDEIKTLLQSTFDINNNEFRDITNDLRIGNTKLLDTYYVLINCKSLGYTELNNQKIKKEIIAHRGEQSVILFNRENGDILTKTMNREDGVDRRVITTLTEGHCSSIVNRRLVKDYLSHT